MILARIPVLLTNLAAASGLVTFVSFAYATWKDVRIQQIDFEQKWQESEIYGIVFEGGRAGVLFGAIHAELNRRIDRVRGPLGLELDPATTESVRRALMDLAERGVIVLREDFTYAVPLAPIALAVGAARAPVA